MALLGGCGPSTPQPVEPAPPETAGHSTLATPSAAPGAQADGGQAADEPPEPLFESERLVFELDDLAVDLDDALPLGAADCDAARDLTDRMCELAERICAIADERPDEPEVGLRCDDGRSRCEEARARVRKRCGV